MSDHASVPTHKLEAGDDLWMKRDELEMLAAQAYFFSVVEYDSEYARVEIDQHADA